MFRRARASLLALVATLLLSDTALAQRHVALVVDNNPSAVTAALPVTSDADSIGPTPAVIARRLKALNYHVIHAERLDAAAMREHIERFRVLAEKAEVAVFYFHGTAIDVKGRNHLVATMSDSADLEPDIVALDELSERMKASKANVVLLDSGYNDPVPPSLSGRTEVTPSLAVVGERSNFLIVMASVPGKVVRRDGRMRFSKSILLELDRTPGDWAVFGPDLRTRVFDASRGDQVPYVRSTLRPGIQVAALPTTTDAGPATGPSLTDADRTSFVARMQPHLVRLQCHPSGAQLTLPLAEQALSLLEQHANQQAPMPRINVATAGPNEFALWFEWVERVKVPLCPPPRGGPPPVARVPVPRAAPAAPRVAVPIPPAAPRTRQTPPVERAVTAPPRIRERPERAERAPPRIERTPPARAERAERAPPRERAAPSRVVERAPRVSRSEGGGGGVSRAPSGGGGGGSSAGRFSPGAF